MVLFLQLKDKTKRFQTIIYKTSIKTIIKYMLE